MEDYSEIRQLIAAVVESRGAAARSCYDRYKAIVSDVRRLLILLLAQQLTLMFSSAADQVPRAAPATRWLLGVHRAASGYSIKTSSYI